MLTTPEDARYLWCPMVRMARHEVVTVEGTPVGNLTPVREEHHVVAGCNTDALGRVRVPASCRCIADKCAMWRWAAGVTLHPDTGALCMPGLGGAIPAKGYCGLAGRPEVAP